MVTVSSFSCRLVDLLLKDFIGVSGRVVRRFVIECLQIREASWILTSCGYNIGPPCKISLPARKPESRKKGVKAKIYEERKKERKERKKGTPFPS